MNFDVSTHIYIRIKNIQKHNVVGENNCRISNIETKDNTKYLKIHNC